ncbi:MAG: response regulator [Phycisphaeraceae bacterium]|nr:response regulator [Phycisphaeraceae bacterium]
MHQDAGKLTDATHRERSWSLKWYLLVVVLASLLPLLVLTVLMLQRFWDMQQQVRESGLQSTAGALSLGVDGEWGTMEAMLKTLAQSPLLTQGELKAHYDLCRNVLDKSHGDFIVLFDPTGQQIFNTMRPFGDALPNPFTQSRPAPADDPQGLPVGNPVTVQEAFATRRPVYSHLFVSLSAGRPVVTIDMPVVHDQTTPYVLTLVMFPDTFSQLLNQHVRPQPWQTMVIDPNGRIVARSSDIENYLGRQTAPAILQMIRRATSGSGISHSASGEEEFIAWNRSPRTGWTSVVMAPSGLVQQMARQSLLAWILGASCLVVAAITLATFVARRISAPLSALAHSAEHVQQGATVDLPPTHVREVLELRRALDIAANAVRLRNEQREKLNTAQALRAQAEHENQRKDDFLSLLGHELRNPLMTIAHAAALWPGQGELNPQTRKAADLIARQTRQMTRLVNDLLDISRINHGRLVLQTDKFDLTVLLREAAEEWEPMIRENSCNLKLSLPDKPVWVEGDRARLSQVVANLLHNAYQFTTAGDSVHLALTHDQVDRKAAIIVSDTGAGMDDQSRAKLFEPYTHAGEPGREGLGLGLSLARHLVSLHGGTIEAHSDGPGKGSRFTITLCTIEAPAPSSTDTQEMQPPSLRFNVLVVDDTPLVANLFAEILRRLGHDVRVAAGGAEALRMMAEEPPQIVFSDISMPGMDGYGLANRIRANPDWSDIYLVAVTGYGQPHDQEAALRSGFDEHIIKPPDFEQLIALFQRRTCHHRDVAAVR